MEGLPVLYSSLATLLFLLQFTAFPYSAARSVPATSADIQFIKNSCSATTYPDLCFSTLSGYANKIQTSPKSLATTALSVRFQAARSTSTLVTTLSRTQGLSPRDAAAVSDCVEELSDSMDELQRSIAEMGGSKGKNFALQMNDIETWVSAALTDENTCMDGFAGNSVNKNVKAKIRSHILKVARMTSNALALVNSYAATKN